MYSSRAAMSINLCRELDDFNPHLFSTKSEYHIRPASSVPMYPCRCYCSRPRSRLGPHRRVHGPSEPRIGGLMNRVLISAGLVLLVGCSAVFPRQQDSKPKKTLQIDKRAQAAPPPMTAEDVAKVNPFKPTPEGMAAATQALRISLRHVPRKKWGRQGRVGGRDEIGSLRLARSQEHREHDRRRTLLRRQQR